MAVSRPLVPNGCSFSASLSNIPKGWVLHWRNRSRDGEVESEMLAAQSLPRLLHSPFLGSPLRLSFSVPTHKSRTYKRSYPRIRAIDLDQNTVIPRIPFFFFFFFLLIFFNILLLMENKITKLADSSSNSGDCERCRRDWNPNFLWIPNWQCCKFLYILYL